ncbi:hypothetical protein O6H91_16G086200 [Diphasiastrum complanatum]|uniref:Uncharacterized protein n=2 Tax=Diphasiastrum complanatum TaxID=34168 RepID=A0ACC2BEK4_DIPCM|nr:hypothetical protein O6H91_16G086200 [Diphasiastrum complanatum]
MIVDLESSLLSQIKSRDELRFQSLRYEADTLSQSQRSLSSLPWQPSLYSTFSSLGSSELFRENISPNRYRNTQTFQNVDACSIERSKGLLYSGLNRDDVRLWRQADLESISSFQVTGAGVLKCLITNGDRIFSAHQDKKIRVWRSTECRSPMYELITTLPTIKNYLSTAIFPQNHVKVHRHKSTLWIQHSDAISVLAIGPGNLLYSGSWDKSIKVWKMSNYRCLESFKAHDDAVNALIVAKSGYVYTGSADSKVKVWERGSQKHVLVSTLEGHISAVNALTMNPDESLLYSASSDRCIMVWEREDSARHMSHLGTLRGHRHAVLCLARAANLLCSGSADKSIRVWRRECLRNLHSCIAVLEGHTAPVKALSISEEMEKGCFVYSGSLDGELKEWWVSTGHEQAADDTGSTTI